ncbi:MAG: HAD-IA family hydrolase [Gammaproteobacteria bacterium]
MPKIRLAIFDMAGTVVDEDNVVYKTLRKVLADQGHVFELETVFELGAGKEKQQALRDILALKLEPEAAREIAAHAFAAFKPALEKAYATLAVKPVAGVDELFPKLRALGVKIGLNTGYDRKTAESLLSKLDWQLGRDFHSPVAADDVSNGRPHPDAILKAMADLGIDDPAAVLKAGDSAIDIEEGQNAGCGITVGVLSGAQGRAQLSAANPNYVLASAASLIDLDLF